jgi:sigma-B regulation protein RsbU (phosphoserine phosphatase)
MYAVAGVGSVLKIQNSSCYQYILGFHAPKFRTKFIDTVGIISSSVTLHLWQIENRRSQIEITKELNKASEIQRGLLPENQISFQGYDIYGVSEPAHIVGGDYFDYVKPAAGYEERLGIIVSDAASKGLSAAVQALFVSGAIRMAMGFHTKISSLVARLNTLIHATFPYERFVTMFYCELLSSENGLVLYANAGHFPPIHYSFESQVFSDLQPTGGILGVIPGQHFQVENINMRIGDVLVISTDGITEAQNSDGEFIRDEQIKDVIRNSVDKSAREIAETLLRETEVFSQGSTYSDDKTLVVIKRVAPMTTEE